MMPQYIEQFRIVLCTFTVSAPTIQRDCPSMVCSVPDACPQDTIRRATGGRQYKAQGAWVGFFSLLAQRNIRVYVDVLCAILDCALGGFPLHFLLGCKQAKFRGNQLSLQFKQHSVALNEASGAGCECNAPRYLRESAHCHRRILNLLCMECPRQLLASLLCGSRPPEL